MTFKLNADQVRRIIYLRVKKRLSADEIAKTLGVSRSSVYTYLHRNGVSTARVARIGGREIPHHHYSKLAKWMKAHPATELPKTVKEIMSATGCTKAQVTTYLYRRRKKLRAFFADLPDLHKLPLRLRNKKKQFIYTKDLGAYIVSASFRTSTVTIRSGEHEFVVDLDRFVKAISEVKKHA